MNVPEFLGEGQRYRVEPEPIARGGMGAVYRAYDKNTTKAVAIKVMLESSNPEAQALFDREWRILADLQHPNIVPITDRGEFLDGNAKIPYFVMPFLRGQTLQEYLRTNESITVERIISIITAAADSLHAAHSKGVIHRDIKPSNIFVLDAGPVVVIDFGVVHLTDNRTGTTVKGTTPYMAPELFATKKHEKPSASSDLFSLGVVCYEALTGRQPFARATVQETIKAILEDIPTPAYELNHKVSLILSQVAQKAMAKDRVNRYTSIKEFAEKLERAFRNEPLPEFDRSTIEGRIKVVREALTRGQTTSAHLLLRSIEEDGLVDPAITSERQKIDQALKQKQIREYMESSGLYRESKQYAAAIEKLNDVLTIDPTNAEALSEKDSIDQERLRNTLDEARLFMQGHRFDDAGRALEEARAIRPHDTQTTELWGELAHMVEADRLLAEQKARLYQEAQSANGDGHLTTALQKLEQIMDLIRRSGITSNSERDPIYTNFYEVLLTERSRLEKASQEVRSFLSDGRFAQARTLCEQILATNPGHPLFETLKLEAESTERESRLDYIRKVRDTVDGTSDLEARVTILREAANRYPNETLLAELLKAARVKRDLVTSLVARARNAEILGRFAESLEHWRMVQECHPAYPSLKAEIDRVIQVRDDANRAQQRAELVREILELLRAGDFPRAGDQCQKALELYPLDRDLLALQLQMREKAARVPEVQSLLVNGRTLLHEGKIEAALEQLRRAAELDPASQQVRQVLGIALLDKSRTAYNSGVDCDVFLKEAKELIPEHPEIKTLVTQVSEQRRNRDVDQILSASAQLVANGDLNAAAEKIQQMLAVYPDDRRLSKELEKLRTPQSKAAAAAAGALARANVPEEDPHSSLEDRFSPSSVVTLPVPPKEDPRPVIARRPPEPVPPKPEPERPTFIQALVEKARGMIGSITQSLKTPDGLQSWYKPIGIGLGVVMLLVIGYKLIPRGPRVQPVVPIPKFSLEIVPTPDDAEVFVDGTRIGSGRAHDELESGNHKIVVSAIGYKTREDTVQLTEARNMPVTLEPLPVELHIVTDQARAQVWVNDEPKDDLSSTDYVISETNPAVYKVKIKPASGPSTEVSFEFKPGRTPIPTIPVERTPTVVFVGTFNGTARTECNCSSTLKINGTEQPLTTGSEMPLPEDVYPAELNVFGDKKLSVTSGKNHTATLAVYWGPPKPVVVTVDQLIADANDQMLKKEYDKALAIVRQVLARDPNNEKARLLGARIQRMKNLGGM